LSPVSDAKCLFVISSKVIGAQRGVVDGQILS